MALKKTETKKIKTPKPKDPNRFKFYNWRIRYVLLIGLIVFCGVGIFVGLFLDKDYDSNSALSTWMIILLSILLIVFVFIYLFVVIAVMRARVNHKNEVDRLKITQDLQNSSEEDSSITNNK